MKTLYLTDLDGTLLQPDATLSDRTREYLEKFAKKGIYVGVASSRSPLPASFILSRAELLGPVILMDGVLDISPDGTISYIEYMTRQAVETLCEAVMDAGEAAILYKVRPDDKITTNYYAGENEYLREFMDERITKYRKIYTKLDSLRGVDTENAMFMTLRGERGRLERLRERIGELPDVTSVLYRDNYRPGAAYFELHSDRASKYFGALRAKRNGGFDRLVGFGDAANDLPMFRACDVCYAVGNAADEVKKAADGVIGKNTEDAVVGKIAELEGIA